MPRTLQAAFTFGLVAAFVLIGGIFTGLHLVRDHRHVETMRIKAIALLRTLVERDREALANELFSHQISAIQLRLRHMQDVTGVLGLAVFDANGNLVRAEGRIDLDPPSEATQRDLRHGPMALSDAGNTTLVYAHPITLIGQDFGVIVIHYDLGDLHAERHIDIQLLLIQLAALLLVLILVVHLFLSREVLTPVRALQGAIARMAAGERGVRVGPVGVGELAALAHAFDRMADDRERADDHRRSGEERLRATLASLHEAVFTLDAHGRLLHANPAAMALVDASALQAELRYHLALQDPQGSDPWMTLGKDAVRRQLTLGDGTVREVLVNLVPLSERADDGQVLVLRDETERLRLAEQVGQADKMQALGQLASGVAHDFNNVLQVIRGRSELLQRRIDDADAIQKGLHDIHHASMRAADLVAKLLAFARKGSTALKPLHLHQVIEETVGMLQHSFDRRIRIDTDLRAPRDFIAGDATQLQNAFINLSINARDAMPHGGHLHIATRHRIVGDMDNAWHLPPGEYLEVQLSDTGAGIPPAILDRIFEPFFTTKPVGHGTGLGLAMVFGTLQSHAGTIRASNRAEGGACFTLLIPLIADEAPRDSDTPATTPLPVAAPPQRLLLVDDEPLLRTLGADMVSLLGHQITTASDGHEAESLVRAQPHAFTAIITDRNMPGMNGVELFRRLHADFPAIPIILASGDIADAERRDLEREGLAGVLQKPYVLDDLQRLLAALPS